MKRGLSVVILAAGMGTRMRSNVPKVLHRLNGVEMLKYVIRAVRDLKPVKTIVVVGKQTENAIKEALRDEPVNFALQSEPLGTAHAVLSAKGALRGYKGDILILNGDTPLITTETLKGFISRHRRARKSLSVLSFVAENPYGYGRIIRDEKGQPVMIKEEKDLSPEEKSINEVNSGVYVMDKSIMSLIGKIKINPKKGEYYLTDILSIASEKGIPCGVFNMGTEEEFHGVNTKEDLRKAEQLLRERIISYWTERDVMFMDPKTAYIGPFVKIGPGTFIYPNTYLEGNTVIGSGCTIYPNVRIRNCTIGSNVEIKDSSVLEDATVEDNAVIGPFARLRPATIIKQGAKIGNFVEVKASTIGNGSKAQHLSYIGDTDVGKGVNIGAGTITCNYDGVKKHKTTIEDNVFIGSDTQLVAPVKVGRGAFVGAGSTITKDVPEYSLALSRTPQKHIKDWVKKKRKKR
ncbi:MAG: UDP-N-acetylglucosamine diphosphorylase/glucosamine-1-phosphate N-acetyltransferase [Nitrospirae bacterium]|nr:UDP-N-acetylglucosamine diphosphorylase/glucosamine-1-phosphate N-acetyltransferase [Nitrospirota bacterium]